MKECFPLTLDHSLEDPTIELSRPSVLNNYALDDDIVDALTSKAKPDHILPLQFEEIFELPLKTSNACINGPHRYPSAAMPQNGTTEEQGPQHEVIAGMGQHNLQEGGADTQEPRVGATSTTHLSPSSALEDFTTMTGPDCGQDIFSSEDLLPFFSTGSSLAYPRM